ncbi:MAG: cytochrome o ubiquinol oxidase subunit IV [Hyphomicrobiaceae bacterium]|nr:cytochrome o ubiquinol oxidase subunit IV [Hyphomicrobiaceae bacterium]
MASAQQQSGPTKRTYGIGLLLAILLTAIPFSIVAFGLLPKVPSLIAIAVAAIIQVGVHLRFFLHLDFEHTPRENLAALFFATFLIFIMVMGSLWIMFDLHHRMM